MTKKRKMFFIVLSIIFLLLLVVCMKAFFFFNAKPNIAVNYVKLINKITRPQNYDPCDNAFFDYEQASALAIDMPEITQNFRSMPIARWPSWPGDMNEVQLKATKDWLSANKQAFEYFEEGSKKPHYWQEMPEEKTRTWEIIFPPISNYRLLSIALCSRAKIDALEGQTGKAFDETIACFEAGNHLIKSRRGLEQMVGQAILNLSFNTIFEILYNTKPKVQDLARLQNQLEEKMDKNLTFDFELDKIIINDFIQHIFSDDGKGNGHLIHQEAERIWEKSYIIQPQKHSFGDFLDAIFSRRAKTPDNETRPFFKRAIKGPDRKQTMEKFDEIFKNLDEFQQMTPWQLHNKGIDPEQQSRDKINSDWLIRDIGGFLIYYPIELFKRSEAEQSAVITTIALLRFKSDKGDYPDNLNELIQSGYVKQLPQDPYKDGPLTYKKVGDDFTLYSLGPDFDDDGGQMTSGIRSLGWWGNEGDTAFWPVKTKDAKKE